jgi:hypothetical protein
MELLGQILVRYGPWGLILVVVIYIILKGEFVFRYPRPGKRAKKGGG